MALQKKKYRCSGNRSRGVAEGVCLDTSAVARGKTPKDYSRQVRSHHGMATDEVQENLGKQIKRKKTYG